MNERWSIFSTSYRGAGPTLAEPNGQAYQWTICSGINRYGDGPDHEVCIVTSSREDAEAICEAHNRGIA